MPSSSKWSRFCVWLGVLTSKIPGAVLWLSQLAVMFLPGIILNGTSYAGLAPYLAGTLTIANAVLLHAKQLPPSSPLADAVDAAINAALAQKAMKAAQRGHAEARALVFVMACGLLFASGTRAITGCGPNALPTAEATIPADANLALCAVSVTEADVGKPALQIIADYFAQCGQDVAPILNQLDTQVVGQVAQGTLDVDTANAKFVENHTAAATLAPASAAKHPAPKPIVKVTTDAGKTGYLLPPPWESPVLPSNLPAIPVPVQATVTW